MCSYIGCKIENGACSNGCKETVFLHGDLQEEICMQQIDWFKEKTKEGLVCKLKKSLYGLKQAPR